MRDVAPPICQLFFDGFAIWKQHSHSWQEILIRDARVKRVLYSVRFYSNQDAEKQDTRLR